MCGGVFTEEKMKNNKKSFASKRERERQKELNNNFNPSTVWTAECS